MEIETLIKTWKEAKKQLDYYKGLESELRDELATALSDENDEGKTEEIIGGHIIKITRKYNYSVKAKVRDAIDDLTEEEKACLNPKYDLKLKNYKKLSEDDKWDLNEYVTVRPGKATIEIKPLNEQDEEHYEEEK